MAANLTYMLKITAGDIIQYSDIDAGVVLQCVPWSITDDEDAILLDGKQSFPLEASSDEIRDFLTRRLAVYKDDVAISDGARDLQAGLDNAASVADEVSGTEITDSITE